MAAPKDGEPHTKLVNGKTANYCDFHKYWNYTPGHTSDGCRHKKNKQKAKDKKSQQANLQANIAALLANSSKDDLFSHIQINVMHHAEAHIFDASQVSSVDTIRSDTDASALTGDEIRDHLSIADSSQNTASHSDHSSLADDKCFPTNSTLSVDSDNISVDCYGNSNLHRSSVSVAENFNNPSYGCYSPTFSMLDPEEMLNSMAIPLYDSAEENSNNPGDASFHVDINVSIIDNVDEADDILVENQQIL